MSQSFWCKVYHAPVFFSCKLERDRWWQRGASRQKLIEASDCVGAILTTASFPGCPQCEWERTLHYITSSLICSGQARHIWNGSWCCWNLLLQYHISDILVDYHSPYVFQSPISHAYFPNNLFDITAWKKITSIVVGGGGGGGGCS